uniref:Uncharacterized protein n=1 Tax=Pyrodinium bahamense TaxID=73915 RepID=A0A7S0B603_9DINO
MDDPTVDIHEQPFRFQGTFCAFGFWTVILFTCDIFLDSSSPKLLWAPVFLLHAVLAGLIFIMTLQRDVIQPLFVLGRLAPYMLSLQGSIARRCPLLKGQFFCTMVSMYFGIGSVTRIPSSGLPHPWISLTLLHAFVHSVNLMCIVCRACFFCTCGSNNKGKKAN